MCFSGQAPPPLPSLGERLGQGTFVSPVFVLNLIVRVRSTDNLPLKTMAVVTLHAPSGLPISTTVTKGKAAQAIFTQLAPGAYYVVVEAPGYSKAREDALVQGAVSENVVDVALTSAVAGSAAHVYSPPPLLPPDVRKELSKGVTALKANNLIAAEKPLKSALKKAGNNPDVLYLAGMLADKKGDVGGAQNYWQKAISIYPQYGLAIYALAQSYLQHGEYAKSRELGEGLLQLEPNSWKAHGLLAFVAFREERYEDAVSHGERALELGKEKVASISIVLAQALAVQGRASEGIEVLNAYLAAKPDLVHSDLAQQLLETLHGRADRFVIAGSAAETSAAEVRTPLESPLIEHWLPPNVDDSVPAVEPGAACDLADVLTRTGEQLRRLPETLDRFSATETIDNEVLDRKGIASKSEKFSFSYVVSIRETRRGHLNVEEYRNGSDEDSVFPDRFATRGLVSQVFVFHPYYQQDFEMSCEGLARHGTGFVWQVRFTQSKKVHSRIQSHYLNGRRFDVPLKGRAWISATNFQVIELQTDLREPLKAADLSAQHTDIEYGPVRFQKGGQELWLPIRAEFFSQLRGRRIHRRHDFSNYLLFSIEDKQDIGKPKPPISPE